MFFRRAANDAPPWTQDEVLRNFKFTNAYRAADRVSQFLIQRVMTSGSQSARELFFRIILFKTFNRIDTWEYLEASFGDIVWSEYSFDRYAEALDKARTKNQAIYSAAYIMPSGQLDARSHDKHRHHLRLIELMMRDHVPEKLAECVSMEAAFVLLKSYPTIGNFLAFQYVSDLNYSDLLDFNEMSFVVAGPGAKRGLRKCFVDPDGLSETDLIRMVADSQEEEFTRRGFDFQDLWGRRLQLIDCQNLFCEVDKYSRVAHPNLQNGPRRIKQRFHSNGNLNRFRFPNKWGINKTVDEWYESQCDERSNRAGAL